MKRLITILFLCFCISIFGQERDRNNYISNIDNLTSSQLELLKEAHDYMVSEDYQQAYEHYTNVMGQFNISDSTQLIVHAGVASNASRCALLLGDYKSAENLLVQELIYLERINAFNESPFRNLLTSLAWIYIDLGNYQEAYERANYAKFLFEINRDFSDQYTSSLRILTTSLLALKDPKALVAAKIYSESTIFRMENMDCTDFSRNDSLSFYVRPLLADYGTGVHISQSLDLKNDAIKLAKKAIELSETWQIENVDTYYSLAYLYIQNNNFVEGNALLEKALKAATRPLDYDIVALNLLKTRFLTNRSTIDLAKEISKNIQNNIRKVLYFLPLGARESFWEKYRTHIDDVNSVLISENHPESPELIFDNILFSKGLLLQSSNTIKDNIIGSRNDSLIKDYNLLLSYKNELRIEKDSVKREQLRNLIKIVDRDLVNSVYDTSLSGSTHQPSWHDVKSKLQSGEAAIEFLKIKSLYRSANVEEVFGGYNLYALVLTSNPSQIRPSLIKLGRNISIEEIDIDKLELYHSLWMPILRELDDVHTIYFSACDELHSSPIENVLIDDGLRVSDKYKMIRVSSTRELVNNRGQNEIHSAVLFGGLNYDIDKTALIAESRKSGTKNLMASRAVENESLRYGVSYLPETKIEVQEVVKILKSKGVGCIAEFGNAGTEETFRNLSGKSLDVLHLATHGYFWSEDDANRRSYVQFISDLKREQNTFEDKAMARSGLFFSGANVSLRGEQLPDDVEDGILTAMELSNMNLGKVDLVVLSACQSGLGEISGDGVFGLQRGFKLAGANTLLMSLWKVDDNATRILMTEFYRHLLAGHSKVESLKQAQLTLRDDERYSDSEYWAGWVLLDALD